MFRYLSLIWSITNSEQNAVANALSRRLVMLSPQWELAFDHEGLRVFYVDAQPGALEPHVLANNLGVVLGAVFERHRDPSDDSVSRPAILTLQRSEDIVASRGRLLLTKYWGNYVALLHTNLRTKLIIKDPTGSLPCFTTATKNVTVHFSSIADCTGLQLPFTLNREYLAARLVEGASDCRFQPLNEMSQVVRGQCMEVDSSQPPPVTTKQLYWTPLNFSDVNDVIEDPQTAARALRATVRAVTHTLAGGHARMLLRLSGGLDSSIINGCLKDAPSAHVITSYAYFNPEGRSDERPWSRLAAQHGGQEHLECPVRHTDIRFNDALQIPPSVEPVSLLAFLLTTTTEHAIVASRGVTAVFTGDGGDSGFCSDSFTLALYEYLYRRGLRPHAFRLAHQIASLSGASTWTVLRRALRVRYLTSNSAIPKETLRKTCQLVNPELLREVDATWYGHPWFEDSPQIPRGTVTRLGVLTSMPDLYQSEPEVIAPLYAQPAVELFFRIPIYVHFEQGRDRGLARRAFINEVPSAILQRRWKDRAPGFHADLISHNQDWLREFLLDGVLVKERMLDHDAVEEALSPMPTRREIYPGEILNHIATEVWVRHWMQSARTVPVAEAN